MARAGRALGKVIDAMRHRFQVADAKLSPQRAMSDLYMKGMTLDDLSSRADSALTGKVSDMRRRFDVIDARLSPAAALDRMEISRGRVESLFLKLENLVVRGAESASSDLESVSGRLDSLNPRNVLARGYGMVTGRDGTAITSVDGLRVGENVTVTLRDGTAITEIKEVERNG